MMMVNMMMDGYNRTAAMLGAALVNFEQVKMSLSNPDVTQLIILAVLLGAVLCSLKRDRSEGPLERRQTDQVKGFAVLMIVLGHLWTHVSSSKPLLGFAGDGVATFLLLSGFGLTVSERGHPFEWRRFITRRLLRVMIPYWIATVCILIVDAIVLGRFYSTQDLVLTFLGVNITPATRHIDYIRWFITFILLWYVLFLIARLCQDKVGIGVPMFLTGCALGLFILDYFVLTKTSYWSHVFAFPAGCWLARISRSRDRKLSAGRCAVLGGSLMGAYVLCRLLLPVLWPQNYPFVIRTLLMEMLGLVFAAACILLIGAMGRLGFTSRFLSVCGLLSYELVLLHGPLLIRYNPVFGLLPENLIVLSFVIFLVAALVVAAVFHWLVAGAQRFVSNWI